MAPTHILSAREFTRPLVDQITDRTLTIKNMLGQDNWWKRVPAEEGKTPRQILDGRSVIVLFGQPSTRTRFALTGAVRALGGFPDATQNAGEELSIAKGESLAATGRILSHNPTVFAIVARLSGDRVRQLAAGSRVPVINAGDGYEHPIQALKDIMTIKEEYGQVDGLHFVVAGDLHARTARSFLEALALYDRVRISLVSPPELSLPEDVKEYLSSRGVPFTEDPRDLLEVMKGADGIYLTRAQKENWTTDTMPEFHKQMYDREIRSHGGLDHKTMEVCAQNYIDRLEQDHALQCGINAEMIASMPEGFRVLHPLPNGPELADDLHPDDPTDPRLAHMRQAQNGGSLGIAVLEMLYSHDWHRLASTR